MFSLKRATFSPPWLWWPPLVRRPTPSHSIASPSWSGRAPMSGARLPTTANDAGLIAQSLTSAGFEVIQGRDLEPTTCAASCATSSTRSRSGARLHRHGLCGGPRHPARGRELSAPGRCAHPARRRRAIEGFRLSDLVRALEQSPAQVRIVVADMAREFPLCSTGEPLARGLALMEPPEGFLIAFSSAPNIVAADGPAPTGPYATALAEMIRQPGLSVKRFSPAPGCGPTRPRTACRFPGTRPISATRRSSSSSPPRPRPRRASARRATSRPSRRGGLCHRRRARHHPGLSDLPAPLSRSSPLAPRDGPARRPPRGHRLAPDDPRATRAKPTGPICARYPMAPMRPTAAAGSCASRRPMIRRRSSRRSSTKTCRRLCRRRAGRGRRGRDDHPRCAAPAACRSTSCRRGIRTMTSSSRSFANAAAAHHGRHPADPGGDPRSVPARARLGPSTSRSHPGRRGARSPFRCAAPPIYDVLDGSGPRPRPRRGLRPELPAYRASPDWPHLSSRSRFRSTREHPVTRGALVPASRRVCGPTVSRPVRSRSSATGRSARVRSGPRSVPRLLFGMQGAQGTQDLGIQDLLPTRFSRVSRDPTGLGSKSIVSVRIGTGLDASRSAGILAPDRNGPTGRSRQSLGRR